MAEDKDVKKQLEVRSSTAPRSLAWEWR